jgi:hypothetical protein
MGQDNKIREKLNAREIQPSSQSWDRLDAMLSVKEEKKNKRGFGWLYIAASFLVFIGLAFWFTNHNTEFVIPQNNGIVIADDSSSSENDTIENSTQEIITKGEINNVILVQQETRLADKSISKEFTNKKKSVVVENSKANTMENNIQKSNEENGLISPEKLLASVENGVQNESIIADSKPNKTSVKVNPNSLLSSVESEINEEYRETTLDKLKRNFNQVKSAVANRNYE